MKVEYVTNGSAETPLIRIFDFDNSEIRNLRELCLQLALGESDHVSLQELEPLEAIDQCAMMLRVGAWDRGVRKLNGSLKFECVLSESSWKRLAEMLDPFCEEDCPHRQEWLDRTGDVKLLLAADGQPA